MSDNIAAGEDNQCIVILAIEARIENSLWFVYSI